MKPYIRSASTKAVFEDVIGATKYDLQTNSACQNRFYLYPDGSMGGVWTRGMAEPGYDDRGTGYNYYDGSSVGPFTADADRESSNMGGRPIVHWVLTENWLSATISLPILR